MEPSILISIINVTSPLGVVFNEHGVVEYGYRYGFRKNRLNVSIDVCGINGVWAGSVKVTTNLWGMSSPIMAIDFVHPTFEDCVDSMWKYAIGYIGNNQDNVRKEFGFFKKEYEKWASSENKMSIFKECFYYKC